jgi:hypothetical protein
MRATALSALGFALVVAAVAACASDKISGPQDSAVQVAGLTPAYANLNCHYTPDGEQSIPVGSTKTFLASSSTDCSGAYAVITNSVPNALGFAIVDGTCTGTTKTLGNLKIARCLAGPGSVKIYTNSSMTTLIQTIGLDRIP